MRIKSIKILLILKELQANHKANTIIMCANQQFHSF